MKYAIIYSSRTGNTQKLAEAIKELLPEEDCACYGRPSSAPLPDAPVFFIGFWTDKGTCDEEMAAYLQRLKDKKIFVFGTAGFGSDPQYFTTVMTNVLGQIPSSNTILGSCMCQGSMPETIGARYRQMLAASPNDAGTQTLLENFQLALSHPDQQDLERLKEAAGQCWSSAQSY